MRGEGIFITYCIYAGYCLMIFNVFGDVRILQIKIQIQTNRTGGHLEQKSCNSLPRCTKRLKQERLENRPHLWPGDHGCIPYVSPFSYLCKNLDL